MPERADLDGAQRWLFDNDYLLWRSLASVAADMPRRFHDRLRQVEGDSTRIEETLGAFLGGGGSGGDTWPRRGIPDLVEFLDERQTGEPLDLAELWAVPTMLRLTLVERLLAAVGDERAVASAVLTLHEVERQDWTEFVEAVSLVERRLARDPAGVYPTMDEGTRDRYRSAVERVASRTRTPELAVCDAALASAEAASASGVGAHVGTYLVGPSRRELERRLGQRIGLVERSRGIATRGARWLYVAAHVVVAAVIAVPLAAYGSRFDADWAFVLLAAALVVPVWLAAELLVQRFVAALVPPRVLPKLDLLRVERSDEGRAPGPDDRYKTLVAVPCLLSDEATIDALFERLERHYVASAAGPFAEQLSFALLADLADSDHEVDETDAALLDRAHARLAGLRARHPDARFMLLSRRRLYNDAEDVWMGWERKRGKLMELNALILRGERGTFSGPAPEAAALAGTRYVITLDADTLLPPGVAAELVGTLAHPLNRARRDGSGRVVEGYTVLQPRVEIAPQSAARTRFSRMVAGSRGLDLYTRAVSDSYMDLFGEGLYAGKGIYEVESFDASLRGAVPDNTVLSHDLYEGGRGRAGLVSDVVVYESIPARFLAYLQRQHRWTRGDWQLLPYLRGGGMSWVTRWAAGQNLIRSLAPLAYLVALIACLLTQAGSTLVWLCATLLLLGTPYLIGIHATLLSTSRSGARRAAEGGQDDLTSTAGGDERRENARLRASGQTLDVGVELGRWAFELLVLPVTATSAVSAIVVTLRRVFVTRRHLLQWRSAAREARDADHLGGLGAWWLEMAAGPVIALVTALLVAVAVPAQRQGAAVVTTLLVFGWALSPAVAWYLSRPARRRVTELSAEERRLLRRVARRTWLYFERFVGPEDQWLPPDHFQESPRGAVAHRTSPTNIGLMLTSTLAAYDMGFLGVRSLLGRVTASLASVRQLETHRGHLLNWYDTKTLQPLAPRYVSTVDSGNLLASLMALAGGCADLERHAVNRFAALEGAVTLLDLYREAAANLPTDVSALTDYLDATISRLLAARTAPATWWATLRELEEVRLPRLDDLLLAAVKAAGTESDHRHLAEIALWSGRLHRLVQESVRDIVAFMPWLDETHRRLAAPLADLPEAPTFADLPALYDAVEQRLDAGVSRHGATLAEIDSLRADLDAARSLHAALATDMAAVVAIVDDVLATTDLEFLYDGSRHVFSIGYDVDNARLDSHAYDLFASEARLASFVAIACGRVPVTHWLHLSRPYALAGGDRVMLSWSGTMFEYLTPSLYLPTPLGSVTDTALGAVVDRQIAFGALKGVPWGVSESGYALTDAQLNYQYYAFGVPDLALARVSDDDLVIAPYASLMALRVDPRRTLANLVRLTELGALGQYGFYEALDFTPSRARPGGRPSIVRSFMAHHHGMSLVTIGNLLFDDVFVERFRHDVRVRSVEYLLHEGVPATVALEDLAGRRNPAAPTPVESVPDIAWDVQPQQPRVQANAVSNGTTTVVMTTAGAGFTRWNGLDVTRWRSDPTTDEWGEWLYLQDLDVPDRDPWSVTRAPTGMTGDAERVTFQPHATTVTRTVAGVLSRSTLSVAQEDDVVIRTVALTNTGDTTRRLGLTSYGEVVLAPHGADVRHPAFGNLFVESSFDPDRSALLFRRRPRSAEEEPVYLLHGLVSQEPFEREVEYDANRRSVIGRGGSVRRPAGLARDRLAADVGSTLDPVYALRARIVLRPHATVRLAVISVMGRSRREVIATADRYRSLRELDRVIDEARVTRSRLLLRSGVDPADLPTHLGLLSHLLYPSRAARADAAVLRANRLGQSGLWAHGISGDHPLMLVRVAGPADLDDVKLALSGHALWREQGFTVDVVILNQGDDGYRQSTHDALRSLVNRSGNDAWLDRPGGVFLLSAQRMRHDEVAQLEAVARVVIGAGKESRFAPAVATSASVLPVFTAPNPELVAEYRAAELQRPTDLEFDNGYGGFADDGKEYVIVTDPADPASTTPAPWVNVIANPEFGTMVSEVGSSTTWAVNSSENRLTPWSNDAVRDPTGEALYLRDEETGAVWTPTPRPRPGPSAYLTRHRAGSTTFEHRSHALDQELTVFVPPDAPVKVVRLGLVNRSARQRRVTATYYARLLLGTNPEAASPHVISEYDAAHGALLARNAFNEGFGDQVAFLSGSHPVHGFTTDREEFIGREGGLEDPAALRRIGLSGELEPGGDPCAALQFHVDLAPGGAAELFFVLGRAEDRAHASELLRSWRLRDTVEAAMRRTADVWDELLGAVQVATPDRSLDVLLNRWLLYQAVSCRLWGRTAFYQSSGAFGFRDQLQDALALVHVRPADLRAQIVRAAAHQFEEGDVLHWWHPPGGHGVRTRFSDDLVWLPYATAHYLDATDDVSVLDEVVPFLSGPELAHGVAENYDRFSAGGESGTVYEHCVRALERACTSGPHGLPLIGSGDWNDGLSRVGIGGRGESVWLAWFLITTLTDFAAVSARRGDHEAAQAYRRRAEEYSRAVEANAWDGDWYLRAFYDDGTPLGSHESDEPKIDAIAQAWAVLSAAADPRRAERAMRSARDRLVVEEERLVLLLAPPFDRGRKDPGYIKGYPPGVRENGGQYTHAATWTLWALADLGHGGDATDLYSLIAPPNLAADRDAADKYRVEPYVIAADVYGHPPHTGMGGWTWYTGSASWYYRLGLERLLGVSRHGDTLRIDPRLPAQWPGYTVAYRFGDSLYRIAVTLPAGTGDAMGPVDVPLVDDGEEHDISITLRTAASTG